MLEISLNGQAGDEARVQAALADLSNGGGAPIAPRPNINIAHGVVTVRALNAVSMLPVILEALAGAGLQPGETRVRQNTLEDVFIQLTGRRLRE